VNPVLYAVLLSAALPLLGVFAGTVAVIVLGVAAAAAHVGVGLIAPTLNLQILFLAQLPTCLLTTWSSFSLARHLRQREDRTGRGAHNNLTTTKERHATLKAQVAAAETEENTSLQIYALAKSLAEALSWKDMAPRLATGIQKIFGSHEFLLYSLASNRWDLLHRRGSWSKEPPIVSGAVQPSAQFFYPPQTQEVVPVLQVPILNSSAAGEQMTGLLFLKNAGERSETDLLRLGNEFGRELGMALSKALLFNQMEMHSRIDGLTGILRRQAFMDRLEDEIKKANAFSVPFCVLMIDIDHFKAVNDGHGHAAGDAVLARVGQILKESIYETDVVGRYGGEEFIVLLPHAELEGVKRKAEALRQRFEREVITAGFVRLQITVSIGLSHFPTHGRNASDLIARADKALYQAKETGRNRVIAA
jgi:diguanylate cyclase (GGDEF)-like protein